MSVVMLKEQGLGESVVGRERGTAVGKRLTVEEFLALCRRPEYGEKQLELDEGRLIIMPLPGELHGALCVLVIRVLLRYLESRGHGQVLSNDVGLILQREPAVVRGADVAFYREALPLSELSGGPPKRLPELVVEVLSPSDRVGAVLRKVQQYLRAGIAMVWVVDGESRNVAVYRPGREVRVLEENEVLEGEDVLPGFACVVGELFRLPGVEARTEGEKASQT